MPLVLPSYLSFNQAAIWLDQQLFAGKPIYNTAALLAIRGELRVDLFECALRKTIAESPGLRLPPRSDLIGFALTKLDFRDEKSPLAAAKQWTREEMRRPIPLDDPALFRFALIQVGDDQTLWFQKYHHIIMDATGRRLLAARAATHYRALRFGEPLPVLDAVTPEELLEAERRYMATDAHEADRRYWLEQITKWPEPLLETDRRKTERTRSGVHARTGFTLKRADFTRLETTARALGSSAFRAIVALSYVAFARLYDRYDMVLGLELANRPDARARQAIGLMARPIPMQLALDHAMTFADALRYVEDARARNYPHRHFPVQKLARELGITRKGHHGLFDAIVNYIPASYDFKFEDFPVELTNLSYGFASPFLITIADLGPPHDLAVTVDTDPGLISPEMAVRLASALEILLVRGMENRACKLASLPIMSDAERTQVRTFAAGKTTALPEDATLATLCTAQAERTPEAVALCFREEQLSYATLHRRAARLARRLAAAGVRPGVVVGIALPRDPGLVAAVLAVHKAGGAYLPLDPLYPADRIRFIVADAAAPIIITNTVLAAVFADSGARLLFDTETEPVDEATAAVELVSAGPNDLAYVLYTSGSTGRPKGVGIEHRNLINLVSWARSIVSDAELEGLLVSTSLNFDLSAFEMFVPLVFGGCLILVEHVLTLQSVPQCDKVRLVNTVPSLLEALLRTDGLPPGVTTVILAGEKLSRRTATSLFDAAPSVRLLNCYGPTETTVYSSWAQIPADSSEPSIGRPIWNTTLHVLGAGRSLLPAGATGELYIGGAGVARGYLDRPELTAERFLLDPNDHGTLYRTGDRVRWRTDGELEFLGRADDQMKINGIRVEPGEIEANLLAFPGITAAVVTVFADATGVRRLTAYLVASSGRRPATEDVRAALARQLPSNMVPTNFVWLDAMPMTPNGKLDRKALPAPAEATQPAAHEPPANRLERDIAAIWEELLQFSPIGVRSDFFDLGGDSLALVGLFASIEAKFGRSLTLDVLAGGLTVAGLAQVLSEDPAIADEVDTVVTMQATGDLPPFFCVHGVVDDVIHLYNLAMRMGTRRPFLGLRRGLGAPVTETLEQIAAHHVAAMFLHQPAGPYYLGGHCFGATLAYEMARQLEEQGHEVGLIAIIDQKRSGWRLTLGNALPALHRILGAIPQRFDEELARAPRGRRLRHLWCVLKRWSMTALGYHKDAAVTFELKPEKPGQIELYEANIRALRAYRPGKLRAPLVLFRAETQPLRLSNFAAGFTLGWGELTEGGVQVRVVPGDHLTMITEPFVRHLAKALSDELDAAQVVPPKGARLSRKN
jgi:amino acid adenylation domain-containing protein